MMHFVRTRRQRGGFTLLELVLAMGLLTMLIGMVFKTARSSLELGHRVIQTQNEEMAHQAFFELLGRRFSSLPGNAVFDLQFSQGAGSQVLSDLTLQNVPLSFSWGGAEKVAKAVRISTVKRGDGYLDIVMRYYENEILEDGNTESKPRSINDNKPFAEIVMLEGVSFFEWRVLDGRTMEYQYDWDQRGRLPLQLELKAAFGQHGEEVRHVFWITPKQNPEAIMRQLLQGNNPNPQNPQNPGNPQNPQEPRSEP